MFKVGDLITGNELNNYGLTNKEATCEVVYLHKNSEYLITVKVVKSRGYTGDTEFTVNSRKFKLVRPKFKGNS